MKKSVTNLVSILTILLIALFLSPSSESSAANGPYNGKYSISYISVAEHDLQERFIFAAEGYSLLPSQKIEKVDGISYSEKYNTLTLKNADHFNLYINDMGDDFKIKLVGENKLYSLNGNTYSQGLSIKFIGDGTLTFDAYMAPAIVIDANKTSSTVSFTDTVTVKFNESNDFVEAIHIKGSTAQNPIVIDKSLKALGSVKKMSDPYYEYSSITHGMSYYLKKGKDTYLISRIYDPTDTIYKYNLYDIKGKDLGTYTYDELMDEGYTFMPNSRKTNMFYLGFFNGCEISPDVKEKIAAPKVSVKASGATAKIKVKKTTGADGYDVSYIRLNEKELKSLDVTPSGLKDFKKSGSKKQTLKLNDLPLGEYVATVTPYKTVNGEKVYGAESKALYFTIK
ncbi:MAG: hypothetical protein K6F93_07390 [Lachnospiraceae bacterium]|nr:hypothetical protein [Lachnospiraceae bacterium]